MTRVRKSSKCKWSKPGGEVAMGAHCPHHGDEVDLMILLQTIASERQDWTDQLFRTELISKTMATKSSL
jgi:hypothetical protein